jgi:putative ABC transport system substrate-binding protein
VSVIGGLLNPNYPDAKYQLEQFQAAADRLGVRAIVLSAGMKAEIDLAFLTLEPQHVGALVVGTDPFFGDRREQLVALAARDR